MIRLGDRQVPGFGLGAINLPSGSGVSPLAAIAGAGAGFGAVVIANSLKASPWATVASGVVTGLGVGYVTQQLMKKHSAINSAYEELRKAAVATGVTLPKTPPRSLTRRGRQVLSTPGGLVSLVQQSLTNAGFDTEGIDNDWGSHTAAAASAYQSAHGMTPTGLPEPELLRSLGVAIPTHANAAEIASALASVNSVAAPRDALKIMLGESGLNPASVASKDGEPVAGGVFGLLVTQTQDLTGMSFDDFIKLSAAEQIPYAAKFWKQITAEFNAPLPVSARDLYWLNFLPATYVPGAPDDYVFVKSDDTYLPRDGSWTHGAGFYTQNESLDHPLTPGGSRKGYITAGDMAQAAARGAMNNPATYAAVVDAVSPQGVA